MDTVLLIGNQDQKLPPLLKKMGYQVLSDDGDQGLAAVLQSHVLDMVILDSRGVDDLSAYAEVIKHEPSTKGVPMLALTRSAKEKRAIADLSLGKVEFVEIPYSLGRVMSRVATQIRLRKFAGSDERSASLSELNAALRDANERLKKEMEDAKKIQQSMLAQALPTDARFAVGRLYEPVDEVGGDWYHVAKLPSGKLCMLIADVTGHGLAAALIGSMTRLATAAAAKELPHELLKGMNHLMSPLLPEGRFVTIGASLYDPATGDLSVARGGHPPAVLVHRSTKTVQELNGDGFAIGFFDESEYTEEQGHLEAGDVLVLYTDGVSEVQNMSGKLYGSPRIGEVVLATPAGATPDEIVAAIRKDIDVFREGRLLKDDVTILVLTRAS